VWRNKNRNLTILPHPSPRNPSGWIYSTILSRRETHDLALIIDSNRFTAVSVIGWVERPKTNIDDPNIRVYAILPEYGVFLVLATGQ
jgi:hypothetical protein